MDGLLRRRHRCLPERLAERRMRVARPRHVLRRSRVLDRQNGFGDHLPGVGTDDVDAQDLVGLFFGEELDKAICIEIGFRTRIRKERKLRMALLIS